MLLRAPVVFLHRRMLLEHVLELQVTALTCDLLTVDSFECVGVLW